MAVYQDSSQILSPNKDEILKLQKNDLLFQFISLLIQLYGEKYRIKADWFSDKRWFYDMVDNLIQYINQNKNEIELNNEYT